MTRETNKNMNVWYLDSCASRQICSDKRHFSDLRSKSYKFVIAGGEIIRSEEVGSIHLSTQSGAIITINNVTYRPRCNPNLISLGQLRESGITYHDHPDRMILKQGGNIIGSASKQRNLFTLDTKSTEKAMIVQGRGRPTYFQSQNPKTRLWHRRFGHASNARIIQASKLVDGIDLNEEEPTNANEEQHSSSGSESDENIDSDVDKPAPIHEAINVNSEMELCDTCVESKNTKIVKSKRMTPTTRRLQEIHTDLWGPHNPPLLSGRNYIALLLNEYTRKS